MTVCPSCGATGQVWDEYGFDDPGVQAVYSAACYTYREIASRYEWDEFPYRPGSSFRWSKVLLEGAGDPTLTIDGFPALEHPSRWAGGHCLDCGLRFWRAFDHDDLYHEPVAGRQLSLPLRGSAK